MRRRQHRWTAALAAVAALGCTAPTALADDTAPPPPGPVPPPPGIGSALAQTGSASTGPLGLPDMSAYGANLLLGQNLTPAAPGSGAVAGIYPLNPFAPDYLVPQNLTPAAPGQGVAAPGIGPTPDDPGTGRIAFLKRLHAMYAAGELDGALLGQKPLDSWDQPTDDTVVPMPSQGPAGTPPAVNIPN